MIVKFTSSIMEASIEKLEWSYSESKINGFNSKAELIQLMKNPIDGLQALRIGTENCHTMSFYTSDIISIDLSNPEWFYSEYYPRSESLRCMCGCGTKIIISSVADCLDRFDECQDAGIGDRMLTLFERIINFPDIVYVDFIYYEDYWLKREEIADEILIKYKLIRLNFPYEEFLSNPDNQLQKGWIDEEENLNIEWLDAEC